MIRTSPSCGTGSALLWVGPIAVASRATTPGSVDAQPPATSATTTTHRTRHPPAPIAPQRYRREAARLTTRAPPRGRSRQTLRRPRHDSNMRHTVPETDALSPELRGRDGSEDSDDHHAKVATPRSLAHGYDRIFMADPLVIVAELLAPAFAA